VHGFQHSSSCRDRSNAHCEGQGQLLLLPATQRLGSGHAKDTQGERNKSEHRAFERSEKMCGVFWTLCQEAGTVGLHPPFHTHLQPSLHSNRDSLLLSVDPFAILETCTDKLPITRFSFNPV
jgi:hypothetical protein